MTELKTGEIFETAAPPVRAMTRTVAIYNAAAVSVAERLEPAAFRSAAVFHEASRLIGAFLTPAAVLALSFGLWRLSADLEWTGNFPIEQGPFSHWMTWIALAIGLRMTGSLMNRPVLGGSASPEKNSLERNAISPR
jgi:hypothetical protein